MVRTSFENSLKIRKLLDIREKSLNFPQKSLNVFESSLNKNNLRFKKKNMFCVKEWLKAQQYTNFPWWTWKVFSYDLGVPGMVHFPLFDVPF